MNFNTPYQGCNLSYQIQGKGDRVCWIQGVGLHGAGWSPQVDDLQSDFECLAFDHRGMGHSQPQGPAPITVDLMVNDLHAILRHAGWESAHFVGHSLGGLVALAFALKFPSRVKSLSLLCTFANGRNVAPLTLRMILMGMQCSLGTRRFRRRGFLKLLYPPGSPALRESEKYAAKLEPLFGHDLAVQPPIVKHQLRAMRQFDATHQIAALSSIPTWIVSGRHDPIAPPPLGRIIADRILGSEFVVLEDAAHGIPISHQAWLNPRLRQFFTSTL